MKAFIFGLVAGAYVIHSGSLWTVVRWLMYGTLGGGVLMAAGAYLAQKSFKQMKHQAPTATQLEEEGVEKNPLFRHFPSLRNLIAWRELGNYPTPVHNCSVEREGRSLNFLVKREDLSSDMYGGNKVRTLQYQLASCEAMNEKEDRKILVVGSGGSNQIVATLVHGMHRMKLKVDALWMQEDKPELDNTLNMLSALSIPPAIQPHGHTVFGGGIKGKLRVLRKLIGSIRDQQTTVLPPGGMNSLGVLGQMGACLELAEQIDARKCDDVDGIYLPVGSSCTITGLIMGIALVRHLKLNAFKSTDFKVVGVPIHHFLATFQRLFDFYKWPFTRSAPLCIRYSIKTVAALLEDLGGVGFDLEEESVRVLDREVVFKCDAEVVGTYGGHSVKSFETALEYDTTGKMTDQDGKEAPHIWVCGHFGAKAMYYLTADLSKSPDKRLLYWQTKSMVQPRGEVDEKAQFEKLSNSDVKSWARKGGGTSSHRRGGWFDYRHLMTELSATV